MLSKEGAEQLARELAEHRSALADADRRAEAITLDAGDAGELAEYLDVQRERDLLAHRIELIERWLDRARVLDRPRRTHDVAELGAVAHFEDVATGRVSTFELVSSPESDVGAGRLSIESPVGRSLLGHHAGDTVEIVTPSGRRRLRVVSIR